MTILRRSLIALLIIILLLLSAVVFLFSESGTKLAWNTLNDNFSEIILDGKLQGRLADDLDLKNLKIQLGKITITMDSLELSWRPRQLFSRKLHIKKAILKGLVIDDKSEPAPPTDEPFTLPEIELPVAIQIDQFQLIDGKYLVAESDPVHLELLSFAVTTKNNTLNLSNLQAKAKTKATAGEIAFNTDINGQIELNDQLPLNLDLTWQLMMPDLEEINGAGNLQGDLVDLNILHQITSPVKIDLTANVKQILTGLTWSADLNIPELNPQNIKADLPELDFSTKLSGKGDLKNIDLAGNYTVSSKDYGDWQGELDINQVMPSDLTIKKFVINSTATEAGASLSGHVDLAGDDAQLDLNGHWQKLAFLDEESNPVISSQKGLFTLKGTPTKYRLDLETDLSGQQIPAGDWTLSGNGSTSSFDLHSLHGKILDGFIDLTGKVSWEKDTQWELKLSGKDLNPAAFTSENTLKKARDKTATEWQSDWPGKLSLSALISGKQSANNLIASIKDTSIDGVLRDYPVKAQTELEILNSELDLKKLNISSANSTLNANGKVGKKLDLKWELQSPDLKELYPEAGGELSAQGTLKGSQSAPQIVAKINGQRIVAPDIKLGSLKSDISLGLNLDAPDPGKNNKGKQNFDIAFVASELAFGETTIEEIKVDGDGSLSAHSLSADLIFNSDKQQTVNIVTKGGVKNQAWTGTIERLDLQEESLGKWQLQEKGNLNASAKKAALDNLCLINQQLANDTSLCMGGNWQASGKWNGKTEISSLPLSLFEKMLSEHLLQEAKLDGTVSANLNASGNNAKNIKLSLQMDSSPGSFSMPDQEGSEISYDAANINFNFDDTGAKGDLLFPILAPTKSPITASFSVPPFDPASANFTTLPITGKIQAKADNLSFLMQFTPELEDLTGSLDIDLDIKGTAVRPQIGGYAKLNAGLSLPSAGIQLEDIKVDATGDNNTRDLVFTGSARSGEGDLKLNGKVTLDPDANWPLDVSITGDRFEAANLPEAWVLISPNLQINNQKNKLTIEGEVTIPEATIEPTGFEDTVSLSDDVVVISDNPSVNEKEAPINVHAKVKVILGDKIVIKGPGFSGAIKGQITAINKPGKPPRGNGELTVYDGAYVAYGQDLEINKGRIIFAGGPIDNPGLDIKATRTIKEIITGIHITGQASDPVLTLFSKPGMNQDNILSYLLTGRPMSEATKSDGQLLASAATSMGLQGGNMLAQGIGQDLGLDDISVGGDDQANAALQIGKYLTPKLYISYGVGIFEPVTSLKMRYDLSDRWSVEGESGTNSGMDFLYKYER